VHGQVQVLAFLEQVDDLFVQCPFSLPSRVVTSQVHQVHVTSVVHVGDQLVGCNGPVSHVVDQQDDDAPMDAIAL
jgi:hypothetical protein